MELTINLNINGEEEPKVKQIVKKTKNGVESILRFPEAVEGPSQAIPQNDILNMMGR